MICSAFTKLKDHIHTKNIERNRNDLILIKLNYLADHSFYPFVYAFFLQNVFYFRFIIPTN